MSLTPPSVPSVAPARTFWRQLLLWGIFALTLGAGLAFAVMDGPSAPVLLEQAAP